MEFTRREFLRLAGSAALSSSFGAITLPALPAATAAAISDSPKYNVILVTIDTLRGDSVGLDDSSIVKTPNLDRLGRQGTWFSNAIVQQPNTNASHTSIFTGVFPFVHGVRQHMIDLLSPNVHTLAEMLDPLGYNTAGLYSWVSLEPGFSGLRGFDTYEDLSIHLAPIMRDPRFQDLIVTYRLLGKYLFLPSIIENDLLQNAQDSVEDNTVGKADVTTDAALRWLDANSNGDKPFFLWLHYYDAHYPYQPPAPFDSEYDPGYKGTVDGSMKTVHYIYAHGTGDMTDADINHIHALYDGAISFIDQQLGKVLDQVDQMNLTNNTIVVATADHGESLGTLGRWFHGPRTNYTDIHVPLVFRLQSVIPANHSIPAVVESIDILPTILDLLHLPTPPIVQGKSLLPLINGTASAVHAGTISMLDVYSQITYLTPDLHLMWNRTSNQLSLYDYLSDPLELNDLAARYSDRADQLLAELQDELRAIKFPNP